MAVGSAKGRVYNNNDDDDTMYYSFIRRWLDLFGLFVWLVDGG
jgi:hypothetical protein